MVWRAEHLAAGSIWDSGLLERGGLRAASSGGAPEAIFSERRWSARGEVEQQALGGVTLQNLDGARRRAPGDAWRRKTMGTRRVGRRKELGDERRAEHSGSFRQQPLGGDRDTLDGEREERRRQ